jgi:peptidylprolyl isomerase/FKBP-type peptidyl-prolyl cis-trans isomerase FklB
VVDHDPTHGGQQVAADQGAVLIEAVAAELPLLKAGAVREGALIDGTVFDSSYERGSPAVFSPADVVPGWTEALQLMKVGDEWLLYLPPELAYGPEGRPPTIPGNSVLVFRLKLLDVAPTPGAPRGGQTATG